MRLNISQWNLTSTVKWLRGIIVNFKLMFIKRTPSVSKNHHIAKSSIFSISHVIISSNLQQLFNIIKKILFLLNLLSNYSQSSNRKKRSKQSISSYPHKYEIQSSNRRNKHLAIINKAFENWIKINFHKWCRIQKKLTSRSQLILL